MEDLQVALQLTIPVEQVTVMIKAMERCTEPGQLGLQMAQFETFLKKFGLNNQHLCERMFRGWAQVPQGKRGARSPPPHVTYHDALYALCAVGVGTRVCQADGLFKLLNEDENGCITRAELLQFLNMCHPQRKWPCKQQLFKEIGNLFLMLDDSGGGSGRSISARVARETFCHNDVVHNALQAINPLPMYFPLWQVGDRSFNNLLFCLHYSHDEKERHQSFHDRVLLLADKLGRDVNGRISVSDWEEFNINTINTHVFESAADLVAERQAVLSDARCVCGRQGMHVHTFIDLVTQMVQNEPSIITNLELAYPS